MRNREEFKEILFLDSYLVRDTIKESSGKGGL